LKAPRVLVVYSLRQFAGAASFTFLIAAGIVLLLTGQNLLRRDPYAWGPEFLGLTLPILVTALPYAFPVALAVGASFSLGRMNDDGETAALAACGGRLTLLCLPIGVLAAFASVWLGVLTHEVCPVYKSALHRRIRQLAFSDLRRSLPLLAEGRKEFRGHRVAASRVAGSEAEDLVLLRRSGQSMTVAAAAAGTFEAPPVGNFLRICLKEGEIWRLDFSGEATVPVIRFRTANLEVRDPGESQAENLKKHVPTSRLSRMMAAGEVDPRSVPGIRAAIAERTALAASPLSFVLVGLALGMRLRGRNVALRVLGTVLATELVFFPFLSAGILLASAGLPQVWVALVPNLAVASAALVCRRAWRGDLR
jgi:lipopolysaccharide export LptBFGC system permease protein LptF